MDNTGIRINDKDSSLTLGYNVVCKTHKCRKLANAKQSDLFTCVCTVISTIACIFTCVCSIYCTKAQTDIKEHCRYINELQFGLSASETNIPMRKSPSSSQTEVAEHGKGKDNKEMDTIYTDVKEEMSPKRFRFESFQPVFCQYHYKEKPKSDAAKHFRRRRAVNDLKRCRKNCKGKKAEKRECRKDCKRRLARQKQTLNSITLPTQVNLPAAHFEANVHNADMKTKSKGVPLRVFKPSDWFDENKSPVMFENSRAEAKTAGIYLVYAQAYIGGKEPRKSIKLVQKHNHTEVNFLSCRTGVHPDLYDSMSGQLQTCSIVGLLNLAESDTIEVQKGADTTKIILDKDKTYFGIVQLSQFFSNDYRKT